MNLGKLRHLIEIQNRQFTQDQTSGEMLPGPWTRVARVYSSVEPLSTREFIAAAATQSEVVARIVIRYRPGIDTTMRILFRDKVYAIEGVLADKGSGLDYLTLAVSEGVSDGS